MLKSISFRIKGMQRDLSASAFSPEYAYENRNIRIMPTDESTLFSMVNEKGNLTTDIENIGPTLSGTPIGQAQIDDNWVIFTTSKSLGSEDRIYKLWFNEDSKLEGKLLYLGSLGFSTDHPIETLSFYENSEIKKIYWVDGLNQPRVINIMAADEIIQKWTDTSFDFVQKLQLQEVINISRDIVTNGNFSPGVIQYAFTYVNSYAQESNIFYTSPLYYISYNNRGANPEDKIGNSFNIAIDKVDKNFEYVRVYSIHRTSIDAIPTIKRVVDLAIAIPGRYRLPYFADICNTEDIRVLSVSSGSYTSLTLIPNESTDPVHKWVLNSSQYSQVSLPGGNIVYIEKGKTLEIKLLFENSEIRYFVNPTGKFVIGGPHGDTGLTGRKIIVDTYGGKGAHGGGAFSGKDPSKVDRSAAYAARHIAKNMVAAGIADEMLVQLSYAIGVAEPISIFVDTYGRSHVNMSDGEIARKVGEIFDLRPRAIEQRLKLRYPIYEETASYGHVGREPIKVTKIFHSPYDGDKSMVVELFTWEKLDYVDTIKEAFKGTFK